MASSSPDAEVITAPTDRRLYRVINLPCGLTALIVHDPEIFPDGAPDANGFHDHEEMGETDSTDEEDEEDEAVIGEDGAEDQEEEKEVAPTKKAAAAMCVGVGSFSDPAEAQGLAHFLEHMLFMGSSEFPDENEYDSYLSKHGGSTNAYTETEHTCYYFDVGRKYLRGALIRFSQFFISPLIKAEAMEREFLAVDSEFNQVLQSDSARLQQLRCYTSLPSHPFNRFTWGNRKSLCRATERGINLRELIVQLYREKYHGGLMKLVVIGGESLDVLQAWVFELFGRIKGGDVIPVGSQPYTQTWITGKIYRLEAVKDTNALHLSWTLPCLHKQYLKKPDDYIAHLLGHEGRGSLLFYLKDKGWATSLSAGVGSSGLERCSVAYIFVMSIHLTEAGLDQVNEIIGLVYQYLKLLRHLGPQAWVFKELQDIGSMEFRYAEELPQDDYAIKLAENLHLYSTEHVIYGEYVFDMWDPDLINYVLNFFAPDNMRVDLVTKSFKKTSEDFKNEPWFGSRYTEDDLSPSLLHMWRDPPEVDSCLHLPPKNEFIPCDFSRHCTRASKICSNGTEAAHPVCLIDEPLIKLWYKSDLTFMVPRANTYFLINMKGGFGSVKNLVLTELFVDLVRDKLNETLYQAGVARLESSISIVGDKLELKLYGFNDKLQILLKEILKISKFSPSMDRFEVIKENMRKCYRNANMKPLNHSTYLRLQILRQKFWDVDDKLCCLAGLCLLDLEVFLPELLSQLHIEGLCHGNLSEDDVISISTIFKTTFSAQILPLEIRHLDRILCMPPGACFIRDVPAKNKMEPNSVVELYFQIEQDVGMNAMRLRAVTDLFDEIVEEHFFDRIRTKEQLGYTVQSGTRMTYRVLGFCFIVQSSKYAPPYLRARIDDFICNLHGMLVDLDAVSFENFRAGLIEQKLSKDPSLMHETDRYWNQVVDKRYMFDMQKLEAEEVKKIQKGDVISWYKTYMWPESPKCRRLSIHIWGCNALMARNGAQRAHGQVICDVDAFKKSSQFYPCIS